MTLQTNAHPRLKPEFENGARRCDYEAVIELVLDSFPVGMTLPVRIFAEWAELLELPGFDYKQMARVLAQKADRGELYRITRHGCYRYGLPVDGFYELGD